MAYETLQAIVGSAIVDSAFRRNLLNKSQDTLRNFNLTPEESAAIAAIEAKTFQGFAQELQGWIARQSSADNGRIRY